MYIRTVRSKTTKGPVEYVQLCHNEHDPKTQRSKTKVLYNFGRADELDVAGVRRLIGSLSRLLPPAEQKAIQEATGSTSSGLVFAGSRQLGGTWMLDKLWERLGIRRVLRGLLRDRAYQTPMERLLFAMVANRALAPASKLYVEHWLAEEVYVPGLPVVDVHQLYRAMDFLLENQEQIQEQVYSSVANLLNLEVDLLFLDTTTTYFEVEEEDPDADRPGLRRRGYGKDNHPELPQVVIGFAVTRDGIPVRCWVWPGNTSDQEVIEEVKADLNSWRLGRVVMVQDTGFNSAGNRRLLQRAGGHYIIGEKMRLGRHGKPPEALEQRGRFQTMANGLEYKEAIVGGDSEARRRFVIVRNPEEAKRDREKRADIVQAVQSRLDALQQLEGEPHRKAACALRSHAVFGRYIRQTQTGKLRLDKGKIRVEEHLDGKYLISTSDDHLPTEDVVLGYKQLAEVERVFRDMKHVLELRPVRHRLADRIKAHVLLCWLGVLLVRVAETETGSTWFQIKKTLATIQLGILEFPDGVAHQSSKLTDRQKKLYKQVRVDPPPRFFSLQPGDQPMHF